MEKSSLTEGQTSEITQLIESKIAREVKDEIRKTDNTIFRALSSLSENSLYGDTSSISVGTALEEGDDGPDNLETTDQSSTSKTLFPKLCSLTPNKKFMT